MKARMRTVLGISGMVIAGSFSVVGIGCSLEATFNTKDGTWALEAKSTTDRICHNTIGELAFDLDGKEFEVFRFDNQEYKHFYEIDCLYKEDSQELILNDDPSWSDFFESGLLQPNPTASGGYIYSGIQEGIVKGTFTPSFEAGVGFQDGIVEASLNLAGGSLIPALDSLRWESLHRQLFLIKDGIVGSPDPIVLNISGNAHDVFGYLYEIGIRDGQVSVDGEDWSVLIDDEGQWADVYVGNTLFTTVSLN